MNLNRKQFLKAVGVIHRERTQGTQKENVDAVSSPCSQRAGEENFSHKKAQNSQKGNVNGFRDLLFEIKGAEKDGDKEQASNLRKQANQVERQLLDP